MGIHTTAFKKMNGLGNDFVMFDARTTPIRISDAAARRIADRISGVGCDQIIILEPSGRGDVFMRIVNADGSEVSACGNATRCVAALLSGPRNDRAFTIETRAGLLAAAVNPDGSITVDMGAPQFAWNEIPLSRPMDTAALDFSFALPDGRVLRSPIAVNVGNPHCVFWVEDTDSYDLASFGPRLEVHDLFPERANISLAEVHDAAGGHRIKLRVWERGAGLTRACGTAACAAAVAGARTGRTGRSIAVELPGGVLSIDWRVDNDHIMMTGAAEFEFDGTLSLDEAGNLIEYARAS